MDKRLILLTSLPKPHPPTPTPLNKELIAGTDPNVSKYKSYMTPSALSLIMIVLSQRNFEYINRSD